MYFIVLNQAKERKSSDKIPIKEFLTKVLEMVEVKFNQKISFASEESGSEVEKISNVSKNSKPTSQNNREVTKYYSKSRRPKKTKTGGK